MPENRNRWNITPEERKQDIVAALEHYLRQPGELSDRHKLLIRDAISNVYRGLFGLAAEDVYDLARDEGDWAARVAPKW